MITNTKNNENKPSRGACLAETSGAEDCAFRDPFAKP